MQNHSPDVGDFQISQNKIFGETYLFGAPYFTWPIKFIKQTFDRKISFSKSEKYA